MYSVAELEGFRVFGGRERMVDGKRVYEPAAGASVVHGLARQGALEAKGRVAYVLREIGLGAETIRVFSARKDVVRLSGEQGGGLEAVPAIPGVTEDPLSTYEGSDGGYDAEVTMGASPVVDSAKKKYKLNSLFCDTTVADKLRVSPRRMQAAKRLALQDPSGAAATLTEYIQCHGFPNAVVTAGDYAKTVNSAIDFIRAMGRTIVYPDVAAPAVVQNGHLEISYDQFHLNDVIWTVRGPLAYANEVNVIYQLAIKYGPDHVVFMMSMETLRLDINIRNERTGDCYTGALHGYSSMEGIQPMGHTFPPELTSEQKARLFQAGKKVSPVCVGDAVVGSAVHVTDKQAIINQHTVAMAAQNGSQLVLMDQVVDGSVSVGADVCAVRCSGVNAQWVLREPVVGERVVLCYSVGESVEYSEVLKVLGSADQLVLSGSSVLRRGASGAAVVALGDSALLGIFSTMRASHVYCAPFSSAGFGVVTDCQSVTSQSQVGATPAEGPGDHTYALMVKRGLLGYLEQMVASVATLYRGTYPNLTVAGLVANVGGEWHTTVNPNESQLVTGDGRMLTFHSSRLGTSVVDAPPPVLQGLPNVRPVAPGERVFAFTKVGEAKVMSSVRIVTHCFSDGKGFVVEDFGESDESLDGALIVAERDAAVVGMYSRRVSDLFGVCTVQCLPLLSLPSVSGVRDVQGVYTELTSQVLRSDTDYYEHVIYGQALWNVGVGRKGYHSGVSLVEATRLAMSLWSAKRDQLMSELGGVGFVEDNLVSGKDRDGLAWAYLAVAYLREEAVTFESLLGVLEGVFVASTPVVGDYPFPRASSAASSGRSRSTHSRNVSASANERLLELEERVKRLTEAVSGGDKRLSG